MFPYSYRNMSGSLRQQEIEVGTRASRASVSMLFQVLQNFHERFYNVQYENTRKMFSIS